MARYSKKNRAILSGIGVGIASIYAIASHFDLDFSTLNGFLLGTLAFFATIVLLAALALLTIKGVARLFGGKRDDAD